MTVHKRCEICGYQMDADPPMPGRAWLEDNLEEALAYIERLRALLIRHHDLACSDQKSGIDFTWTLPFRRLTEDIAAALKEPKP